jgi:uncharacterized protein (TIGR03118 family)
MNGRWAPLFLYPNMKMTRFGFGSSVAVLSICGLQFLSMIFFTDSARGQSASPTPSPVSGQFDWTNLQGDIAGVADRTDPGLVNPWGLTINPVGVKNNAFWISDNNSGLSTLYALDGTAIPLIVVIPPTSADPGPNPIANPTGIVVNTSKTDFILSEGGGKPAAFIFDGEDGSITAWNGALNPITQAVIKVDNSSSDPTKSSVYKGLALATRSTGGLTLYATNFHNGTVDVYDNTFKKVTTTGNFSDPSLPPIPHGAVGWAPFGIVTIDNKLYVTFAAQNTAKHDDVSGPGNGFVDVFDTEGNLLERLATGAELNSPWGLAKVPANFGSLDNKMLLVGNFGDGKINVYNINTKKFAGQLTHRKGQPLQFDGLWSLLFVENRLYFTAGINHEADGLFGFIVPTAREETGGF